VSVWTYRARMASPALAGVTEAAKNPIVHTAALRHNEYSMPTARIKIRQRTPRRRMIAQTNSGDSSSIRQLASANTDAIRFGPVFATM
jgi:hypothetical protein